MAKVLIDSIAVVCLALGLTSEVMAAEIKPVNVNVRLQVEVIEPETGGWLGSIADFLGMRDLVIPRLQPGTRFKVASTGYAPSPYQTDTTPCITASGVRVRRGTVAANWLPFGTLLEINGEIFMVEDRMNPRYGKAIDIFFPSTSEALEFGKQDIEMVIVGYDEPGAELSPTAEAPAVEIGTMVKPVAANGADYEASGRWLESLRQIWRVAGRLVSVRQEPDVNRYDIDCFSEEAES